TQGLVATATQPLSGGSPALGTGVIASYPSCTVNVFLTGTIIPATLYSCASSISCSLPSQFTANADGSFLFFAASGAYDITTSGAGMPAPFTVTGWQLGASGSGGGLADPGANGIIKRTALNVTAPALFSDVVSLWSSCTSGFLAFNGTCSSGTSGAFEVNTTPLLSTSTINFENSAATNGLTLTFTNPTNGNVQLGLTGTLTNAGLANSAITIAGTSVSLGGSTTSFPAPGPIGGTTPASGAFTTLSASSGITGNLTGNVTGNATTATNAAGLSNCTVATSGSICYWTGTQWQVLLGNASGSLFLQETSAGVPSWTTPPGGGNVSNSGTPTSGQLAYWTGSTTIQGLTTLTAASEPAHTGDMTNTAGSLATTVAHLNGGLIPASATILGTNGSSQPIATALASTDIFVGNGSNLPVGVAASQDVSLANTGAFTVTGLQTKAIAALSAFTTSPYMTYNGTIWTGANPFASPSFTGTVTFPITGIIQCLHATAAGVLQGTGADCGTGSGGGNVTGPGSSVVGDVAYFNNTGGSLIADAGYPYNAIPNADLAHSTIGISGTANQITSSTSTPALGGTTTLAIANPFTFPGKWTGAAGTTSASTANVPSGVAPTSPVSGDLLNLSGILQFYDGAHTNSLVTIQAAPTTLHIAQFSGTAGLLQDGGVLGTFAGQNYATPPAIGGTTPAAITGTTITANTGFSGPLNGSVGATTPNTGAFTTLSASSTVSGSGFSTYLASPPAIGGTAPAAGTFTTLSAATLSGTFGGSPTFSHALAFPTGTTCITQTTGDSSTDCATDAFVINEIGAGTPGTGTVNDLAYWNTGATLGSIGSPVSGQMLVSENGLAPVFSSPTLADSVNSPVTSASYALACDTSTGIVDRTHVVRFQSGASAPIVPLSTFSGCSGMAVKVIDESAGSLTFSRSS